VSSDKFQDSSCTAWGNGYLVEDFPDEVAEARVEFWEFGGEDGVDYSHSFSFHDLVHFVVDLIGGGLHLFEEGVEEGEEGVDGGEAGDGGVTGEVYHGLLDVLIGDVFGGGFIVLVLVDLVEFLPNFCADGVFTVLTLVILDATQRVLEYPDEGGDAFPCIVDHFRICVGHPWS
jgi:hypothetical protein